MSLVVVQAAVGISNIPQQFDHANPIFGPVTVADLAGERIKLGRGMGRLLGFQNDGVGLARLDPELGTQHGLDYGTLAAVELAIDDGGFDQKRSGRQAQFIGIMVSHRRTRRAIGAPEQGLEAFKHDLAYHTRKAGYNPLEIADSSLPATAFGLIPALA